MHAKLKVIVYKIIYLTCSVRVCVIIQVLLLFKLGKF